MDHVNHQIYWYQHKVQQHRYHFCKDSPSVQFHDEMKQIMNTIINSILYPHSLTSFRPSSLSRSVASLLLHIPSLPYNSPPSERFPSSLEPLLHSPVSHTPECSRTDYLDTAIFNPFSFPTSFTLIARREDIDIVHPFPSSKRGSELQYDAIPSFLTSNQTNDSTLYYHTPLSFQHRIHVPFDRFKTNKPCIE